MTTLFVFRDMFISQRTFLQTNYELHLEFYCKNVGSQSIVLHIYIYYTGLTRKRVNGEDECRERKVKTDTWHLTPLILKKSL